MSKNNNFKVTFIGTTNVGKTCLLMRIDKDQYNPGTVAPTASMQCFPHTYKCPSGQEITINFWDTAGQERFKGLGSLYYQKSNFCIAVFDVTAPDTFKAMEEYIDSFNEHSDIGSGNVIVAANKADLLEDEGAITEYVEWAEQHNYLFFVTSAKTRSGIEDLVASLVAKLDPAESEPEKQQQEQGGDDNIDITISDSKEKKKGCC